VRDQSPENRLLRGSLTAYVQALKQLLSESINVQVLRVGSWSAGTAVREPAK
jgi:hypothetical protein